MPRSAAHVAYSEAIAFAADDSMSQGRSLSYSHAAL